jgi:hypothetical protein
LEAQRAQGRSQLAGTGWRTTIELHEQAGAPGDGYFPFTEGAKYIPELVEPMKN